jgi:hypothetical protein
MIINRHSPIFRPYAINGRTVKDILFFDENGIVFQSNRGWLEVSRSADIERIELEQEELKTRRKENFKAKEAYLMSTTEHGEKKYLLYIPCSLVDLTSTGEVEKKFTDHSQYFNTFSIKGKFQTGKGVDLTEITLETYNRTVRNDYGLMVEKIHNELKSKNIKLDEYTLKQILNDYDLVAK